LERRLETGRALDSPENRVVIQVPIIKNSDGAWETQAKHRDSSLKINWAKKGPGKREGKGKLISLDKENTS